MRFLDLRCQMPDWFLRDVFFKRVNLSTSNLSSRISQNLESLNLKISHLAFKNL